MHVASAQVEPLVRLRVEQSIDQEKGVQNHGIGKVLLARQTQAQQVLHQVVAAGDARY